MTHRPWLATYRECGIPAQIEPNAHRSVVHLLEVAMKKYADKPAFRSFGQTLTYADARSSVVRPSALPANCWVATASFSRTTLAGSLPMLKRSTRMRVRER
jgi:hypothetical protein